MTTVDARSSRMDPVLESFAVDRTSPIPLYFQIAEHLQRAIDSGELPAGTLLENEMEPATRLGLSRPTMRQAMQFLVDKGLVVRRRGIGTRVVQPKVRRLLQLTSLYDDLARSGRSPSTRLLVSEMVPAEAVVAEQLAIPTHDSVLHICRLRYADKLPIAKLTNYLPTSTDIDATALEQRGLYDLIRATGIHLHAANQTVGARTATAKESTELEEDRKAALLTMERVAYDDHGVAVEYGTHIYAASRYSFEMSLLAS